jgi:hypothetical protein
MRRSLFVLIWAFVFLAAAYDAYFAWQYRAVLSEWELNPVARWGMKEGGMLAVFAVKFLGLTFAAWVAVYCGRHGSALKWPLTLTVGCIYALLCLHYCAGFREAHPHVTGRGRLVSMRHVESQ